MPPSDTKEFRRSLLRENFFRLAFCYCACNHRVKWIKQNLTNCQVESSSNFIERLEKLRFKKRWTWAQVAEGIGLSRTMIHFIKKGKNAPSDKVLHRLAEAELEAGLTTPNELAFDRLMNSPVAIEVLAADHHRGGKISSDKQSLATPANLRAIVRAFKFEDADPEELMSLFEKVVTVSNNAPPGIVKYFVLFRTAIASELHRRIKKK